MAREKKEKCFNRDKAISHAGENYAHGRRVSGGAHKSMVKGRVNHNTKRKFPNAYILRQQLRKRMYTNLNPSAKRGILLIDPQNRDPYQVMNGYSTDAILADRALDDNGQPTGKSGLEKAKDAVARAKYFHEKNKVSIRAALERRLPAVKKRHGDSQYAKDYIKRVAERVTEALQKNDESYAKTLAQFQSILPGSV